MMGERTVMQEALFYSFRIEDHVPADHLLRSIDRFVDLSGIREHLKPFYSATGRPSIDPELMIRMLIVGYCMGIRSERRLCEEVHLNLAYRWFCRLDLDGAVPDHSTFSKNRHGRFRDSDLLRKLFELTVERCMAEGLVGAEGFAVDASLIRADVHRQRSVPGEEGLPPEAAGRAVAEYLDVLDDAAFGGSTPVTPKRINLTDPASRWTAATRGSAFYAYSTNYLIDLDHAVIVDVEATTAIRQAEVTAQRRMIERTQERFGLWPEKLVADTAYRLERRHQKDVKAFAKADDVHAALNAIQIRIDAAEARETTLVEEFDTASEHLADAKALVWTEESKADSEASRYDHLKYLAVRHALGNVSNDISYVLLGLMRDGRCEVCGSDGLTELAAELSARQLEHRCLMCGSPRGDENVVTTSAALAQQAEMAFEELERQREVAAEARSRFDEASKRVNAIRSALDEVRREVDGFKRHRRVLRTQLPPEDRTALARAESEIDRLRLGAEGFEQDREIAERQVDELLDQLRNAVIGFRERIQEIFDRRAKDFFIERVRLVYAPRTEKIAQHRDGLKFQFPAFEVDLTSGVSGSAFVRRTYEQASLSQREYLDIAFRMAFMEALGAETCSIVIDGPEGSVDVVFADRAGDMLAHYAAADGGPRNRQIIVACNVVEGGFIPHYFLDHPAATDRDERTVNLLDIAHPTAALEALRPDYEAKVNAVLYRIAP